MNSMVIPVPSTATSACSQFAVSDCTYDGSQCQHADPKVVITGGHGRRRHHT
jgi:hypothetical protein